jgi:peptidoglycan/LPS O-acetylase OafA/YrhL
MPSEPNPPPAPVSGLSARNAPARGIAGILGLRPESDRFLHLDALRFLAAGGVVGFHYQEWLDWRFPPVPMAALFGFGQFVDLFFVISGIVIYDLYRSRLNGPADYGRFLLKRVARLLPLHWLTLGFFAAIALLSRRFGSDAAAGDWACLVPNLTLTQAFGTCDRLTFNTPSWSISAEMALYLTFPLTLWLAARPRLGWAVWLATVGLLFLIDGSTPHPWYARTFDLGVVRAVPAFLFGALLAEHAGLLARVRLAPVLMWLALGLFIALRVAETAPAMRLAIVYLVPVFGLAADRRGSAGWAVRALAPWGQLTYSLYMLHLPVAWICLSIIARRMGLSGAAMNVAVVATAFVILPGISVASLRLFEGPLRRAISGAFRSRNTRSASSPAKVVASDFAP